MRKIEIRTTTKSNIPVYKQNIENVIVFLRHPEDKIVVKNGDEVILDVYDNGEMIFSGSKEEFFNKLKK